MASSPPIPRLTSLDQRASWCNRAGRVDRSACFTLTAAKLWRLIPEDGWSRRFGTTHTTRHADAEPKAKRLVSSDRHDTPSPRRPDRIGLITLAAEDLWFRHRFEKPNPLRGDYRTTKSSALKAGADATRWWREVSNTPAGRMKPGQLDPPAINPNRGAGFSRGLKMLGLSAEWSTTLTIERYAQHDKLKQHFLVCPVCGPGMGGPDDGRDGHRTDKKKLPGGRVTKLFLPLCTRREWEDAQRAWLWLQTHTKPNRPLPAEQVQLIERYGELFPGRQLRCRVCLGLRYGEVKGLK